MKILYAYEFAQNQNDLLGVDLFTEMQRLDPKIEISKAHGLISEYNQNGTGWKRIINLIYMHIIAPIAILRSNANVVILRTTPPLLQITYSIWCKIFKKKCIVWLMDYHPVVECKMFSHKKIVSLVFSIFDYIDRKTMKFVSCYICLDSAMEEIIKERCLNAQTLVYPTWNIDTATWLDLGIESHDRLKLLYSGNLASAHSFELLKPFLIELKNSNTHNICLCYCGDSEGPAKRIKALCDSINIEYAKYPRVKDFSKIGDLFKEEKFSYGIVILNQNQRGTVSPSKFNGYISFGLPILYFGPKGTNAYDICDKYNAGIAICDKSDIDEESIKMCNKKQHFFAQNTKLASEAFSPLVANKLAKAILMKIASNKL